MGIGVAVAAVAAGVGLAVNKAIRVKTAKRLEEREALADDDIYRQFYASSGYAPGTVAELWHEIARELRVPPEKIRPDDVFGKDIGACWLKCKEMDGLRNRAQQRVVTLGQTFDPARLATVDAYVRHFANGSLPGG